MDIYVLEYQYFTDYDTEIYLYATEKEALTQALRDARKHIKREWNLDDEDTAACLEEMNEFEANGMLRQSLDKYNEWESDLDEAETWLVYRREVVGTEATTPKMAYKATTEGATCRTCKNWNEYAYADQPDGIYHCHQCSTFNHILGIRP